MTSFDSISGQRHQLNTQKRNRTSTIDGNGGANQHHVRGNSLNVQELHNTYNGKNGSG